MTTFLPSSVAAATARLTATVVRPTPPLGLKTATIWPGSPGSPDRVPLVRGAGRGRHGGDRHPALLVALASADLADRGGQLVAAERLDQELARAGEHRAAQVVGLALDGHHHDCRAGDDRRELLGRGDAVHVRHVDVHQHDVRDESSGHLQCLATGRGGSRPRRCHFRSQAASSGDRGSRGCRRRRGHGSGRPFRSAWFLWLPERCDGWCGDCPRWAMPDPGGPGIASPTG